MKTIHKQYSIASDIRFRRVLDEAVVVKQDNNQVIVVNEVSASILEIFEKKGPITVTDLVEALVDTYEVDRQTLKKDTLTHLEELQAAEIIISIAGNK